MSVRSLTPDESRAAMLGGLAVVDTLEQRPEAAATLRAALLAGVAASDPQAERSQAPVRHAHGLPLKTAAFKLQISVKTARRRARAGGGYFQNGKWYLDINSPIGRGERT